MGYYGWKSQQVFLIKLKLTSTNFEMQSHNQKAPRNSYGIPKRSVSTSTLWKSRVIVQRTNRSESFVTQFKCRCGKSGQSTGSRPGRGRNQPRPKEEYSKFYGLKLMSAKPYLHLKRSPEILLRATILDRV